MGLGSIIWLANRNRKGKHMNIVKAVSAIENFIANEAMIKSLICNGETEVYYFRVCCGEDFFVVNRENYYRFSFDYGELRSLQSGKIGGDFKEYLCRFFMKADAMEMKSY